MALDAKLPPRPVLWAVFAAIVALACANLGTRDLLHPDEGRYAEIAREMAVSGDFVTPRLNDLKYFEKPPLQYWITAAAFRVFGAHEWTARLWPAMAGLLAVLAVGIGGYALAGPALGVFAAIALAGTLWHAGMAQILSLDAGLAFFLALAFAALAVAQQRGRSAVSRREWMWLAWVALAGATLSKGPIGIVLPAGAVVVYSALTRDYALWRRLHLLSGATIFLALTAPWFVAAARSNHEFLSFFFIHEHLDRYLTEEHRRVGAWWYFIPLALAGSLPWLAALVYGARRTWRDRSTPVGEFSWRRLALAWAAFVFVFFSASGSKLPSYILPMFAPLALVAADLLLALPSQTLVRLTLPGAILAFLVAVAVFAGYDRVVDHLSGGPQPVEILAAFGPWLEGAVAVAAAGAMAAAVAFARADASPVARFAGATLLSLSTLAAVTIAVAGFDAFSATRSTSAILRAAQAGAPIPHEAPVYQIAMYDQTVPFYLGRTTTLVAFRDELALGIDAEPERQIPTLAAWIPQWSALATAYAVMTPDLYDQLAAAGVPMRVLARDSRRVIVART
jgi:4-amino-4-deoxy-L-arabinose transferase-like glycosyltransferase